MDKVWRFLTPSKFGPSLERASKKPWKRWELETEEGLNPASTPLVLGMLRASRARNSKAVKPPGLQIMLSSFFVAKSHSAGEELQEDLTAHKKLAGEHRCRLI